VKSLEIVLPDELFASISEAEMQVLAQEALLVKLYELGKVGSGGAARLLGISRRAFLTEVLDRYGVSSFDENVDLEAEAARG
jgi:predicted HTH domain antitoxin